MKQHQKKTGGWIFRKRQAHCLVAQADTQPKPAKELALPTQRLIIINKARNANTQYKTVGVQWFARLWFSYQLFPRWIRTRSENPTVSYCQTLCVSLTKHKLCFDLKH